MIYQLENLLTTPPPEMGLVGIGIYREGERLEGNGGNRVKEG